MSQLLRNLLALMRLSRVHRTQDRPGEAESHPRQSDPPLESVHQRSTGDAGEPVGDDLCSASQRPQSTPKLAASMPSPVPVDDHVSLRADTKIATVVGVDNFESAVLSPVPSEGEVAGQISSPHGDLKPQSPDIEYHEILPTFQRQSRKYSGSFQRQDAREMVVLTTRVETAEARTKLRRTREQTRLLDTKFMQEMRRLFYQDQVGRLSPIMGLFEKLESSKDALYLEEDDYNLLEDRLNQEEYELNEVHRKTFNNLASAHNGVAISEGHPYNLDKHVEDQGFLDALESQAKFPGGLEYQSYRGDLDMALESLGELQWERAHLVEEQQVKARLGLSLDEDSLQFLEEFDSRHKKLQDDVSRLQNILKSMKLEYFGRSRFDDEEGETGRSPSTPLTLQPAEDFVRDPLLLGDDDTKPTYVRSLGKLNATVYSINEWLLAKQGSMGAEDFLNSWLLNRLRTSAWELGRYKSALHEERVSISQDDLCRLVLEWWTEDGAAGDTFRAIEIEARGISLFSMTSAPSVRRHSDTDCIIPQSITRDIYFNRVVVQVGDTVKLALNRRFSV